MIVAARTGTAERGGVCLLDEVVDERAAFWRILAVEQSRDLTVDTDASEVEVGMSQEALEALIDALVGNVFDHTAPGTGFAMSTGDYNGVPWLEVSDMGPGFSDDSLIQRGMSRGGSTGLGLDIARRTAELNGGRLELSNSPDGGRVRIWFGAHPR